MQAEVKITLRFLAEHVGPFGNSVVRSGLRLPMQVVIAGARLSELLDRPERDVAEARAIVDALLAGAKAQAVIGERVAVRIGQGVPEPCHGQAAQ